MWTPNIFFCQLGLPSEAGLGHFWEQRWTLVESYPSENLGIHGFPLAWLAGGATGPTRLSIQESEHPGLGGWLGRLGRSLLAVLGDLLSWSLTRCTPGGRRTFAPNAMSPGQAACAKGNPTQNWLHAPRPTEEFISFLAHVV